jgi:hypothetical protein
MYKSSDNLGVCSRLCLIFGSSRYNGSFMTWTAVWLTVWWITINQSVKIMSHSQDKSSYIATDFSRPVCLGVRHPSRTRDQSFLSFFLSFFLSRQLDLVVWGNLWREVGPAVLSFCLFVCLFGFFSPLGIASVDFLSSESHRTHEHILLILLLGLPQPGGSCSCIYFPQEQGSPVIPPESNSVVTRPTTTYDPVA